MQWHLARTGGYGAVVLLLGLASALVASALFNVGLALQALEARATPKSLSLRVSLLVRLLRRPRWLIGWLLGIIGIGPQVLALATAPFVVVQPALAVGLLLLLGIGSRTLGERVGIPGWIGVVSIVAGVALVAAGAPAHTETHRGILAVAAVVAALSIAGLVPFAVRGTRLDSALLVMVASGAGFAATNIATKLMSDDIGSRDFARAVIWAAVGVGMGVAATLTGMTAFQRRSATIVVPLTTAVQTFLPIVMEPLFLRERWTSAPLGGAPIVAGLLVAVVGTTLVARTHSVSELASGGLAR
jgi:drug/metabolite transporter (DMT)-like permease